MKRIIALLALAASVGVHAQTPILASGDVRTGGRIVLFADHGACQQDGPHGVYIVYGYTGSPVAHGCWQANKTNPMVGLIDETMVPMLMPKAAFRPYAR